MKETVTRYGPHRHMSNPPDPIGRATTVGVTAP